MRFTCLIALFVACCVVIQRPSSAALTINAFDTGWYDANGSHNPLNISYAVGQGSSVDLRDFFAFDLSAVSGTITGAQLRAYNPGLPISSNGYSSPDPSENFSVFDVSTSLTTLLDGTGGVAAYTDLGSGTQFGSAVVSAADNNQFVTVNLNTDAVAAINAALGGNFAIGGSITTITGTDDQIIFGFITSANANVQLILEEGTPPNTTVPEPATIALWGFGALACAVRTFRRRRLT